MYHTFLNHATDRNMIVIQLKLLCFAKMTLLLYKDYRSKVMTPQWQSLFLLNSLKLLLMSFNLKEKYEKTTNNINASNVCWLGASWIMSNDG